MKSFWTKVLLLSSIWFATCSGSFKMLIDDLCFKLQPCGSNSSNRLYAITLPNLVHIIKTSVLTLLFDLCGSTFLCSFFLFTQKKKLYDCSFYVSKSSMLFYDCAFIVQFSGMKFSSCKCQQHFKLEDCILSCKMNFTIAINIELNVHFSYNRGRVETEKKLLKH